MIGAIACAAVARLALGAMSTFDIPGHARRLGDALRLTSSRRHTALTYDPAGPPLDEAAQELSRGVVPWRWRAPACRRRRRATHRADHRLMVVGGHGRGRHRP